MDKFYSSFDVKIYPIVVMTVEVLKQQYKWQQLISSSKMQVLTGVLTWVLYNKLHSCAFKNLQKIALFNSILSVSLWQIFALKETYWELNSKHKES